MSLYEYDGPDKIILSTDMKLKLIEERKNSKPKFVAMTELFQLDDYLKGFRGADLITITGLTGNGKTLFARTLTKNFADQGIMCCWFCYENLTEDFLDSFGKKMPVFSMPSILQAYKPDWLHTRIREAKEKYNAKIFFIDHLHFVIDVFMSRSPSLSIGKIMRDLKRLAIELEVCIVMIAHTSKVKIDNGDTELHVADIRDSSFIAQESDTCLLIWRTQAENGSVVKIGKARYSGNVNKKIQLVKGEDGFLREVWDYEN